MKSGSANPPFFFIFKIFLDILGLMLFHIDLRVSLSVFLKKKPHKTYWNFDWNFIESSSIGED